MSFTVNTGQTYTDTFLKGIAEGVYINETLDKRSEVEKLFGLSVKEILDRYGLSFKKNNISFHGQTTYTIDNDAEALIYLILSNFKTNTKALTYTIGITFRPNNKFKFNLFCSISTNIFLSDKRKS